MVRDLLPYIVMPPSVENLEGGGVVYGLLLKPWIEEVKTFISLSYKQLV